MSTETLYNVENLTTGHQLTIMRSYANVTKRELATNVGVTIQTIIKYEKRENLEGLITLELAKKIVHYLKERNEELTNE